MSDDAFESLGGWLGPQALFLGSLRITADKVALDLLLFSSRLKEKIDTFQGN